MKHFIPILLFISFFDPLPAGAQTDQFTGTWRMVQAGNSLPVIIKLEIGEPENNLLYPAELTLEYDSFAATYHLLLVKRNARQLAIGRNKIPSSETPFGIGNLTVYLNGLLDLSRDNKANLQLTAERLPAKQYGVTIPDINSFIAPQQKAATRLRDLLRNEELKLKKVNNAPWKSVYTDSILNQYPAGDYYGITDSVHVNERSGSVNFTGNKKSNGVVSVVLNAATVIDQNDLDVRKPTEDLRLDTGMNILVFFADSYGKTPAMTGNLNVDFGDRKFSMDFSNFRDLGATFIVAKIFYAPEKEDEKENNSQVSNSILRELSEADLQRDIKNYHYPDADSRNLLQNEREKAIAEKALLRNSKPVGNVRANARKIILALWDDAVEDGDSISLNINGHWVVQAFPVKKKPQFIEVTLDPGPNKIIFIADNLGSIIPNTAILEIIDGRQRRSFMIDTDLGHNNLINILYELKP